MIMENIKFQVIPKEEWSIYIDDIISVRTSAYEQWNGQKTLEQRKHEANSWLEKWSEQKNPFLLVAKSDDLIVGFIKAEERVKGEYQISWIGVSQDFKRRGIGRSLIQKCKEVAITLKHSALTTTTFNRFRGMLILLLSEGFYIQGTTWIEGSKEPMIYLRKELKI
jgi:GNAT superfamily N-acetyltransferase